jgi:hypothetical protein
VYLTSTSLITSTWFDNGDANNTVSIYAGLPAVLASADPNSASPPSGAISTYIRAFGSIFATTQTCRQPGLYTVYFFNRGSNFPLSTGDVDVLTNTC